MLTRIEALVRMSDGERSVGPPAEPITSRCREVAVVFFLTSLSSTRFYITIFFYRDSLVSCCMVD